MAKRKHRKAAVATTRPPVDDDRGWITAWSALDPMHASQAFQLDIDARPRRVQSNWAVWACQTLIAGDIAKLRISLVEKIKGVPTGSRGGHQDVPNDDVIIEKAEIVE